jgi:hypothetical protein
MYHLIGSSLISIFGIVCIGLHSKMHSHYISVISLSLACTSLALPRKTNGTYHSCRALPGDADWPSAHAWQAFNATVNGQLIATTPLAQPCHGDFYDVEKCESLKSQWDLPWIQYVQLSRRLPTIVRRLTHALALKTRHRSISPGSRMAPAIHSIPSTRHARWAISSPTR